VQGLLDRTAAFGAFPDLGIRKLLDFFEFMTTLLAHVLVDGHGFNLYE
jgi:hypothetical protein